MQQWAGGVHYFILQGAVVTGIAQALATWIKLKLDITARAPVSGIWSGHLQSVTHGAYTWEKS